VVCLIGPVGKVPQERYKRPLVDAFDCQFSAASEEAVVLSQSTEQLSYYGQGYGLLVVDFDNQHTQLSRRTARHHSISLYTTEAST
jgi:hypothetical protein